MKVLLIKDIPGVGHRGQVKDVSDGYAHNFLFARNLAVPEKAGIATAIKTKDETVAKNREREKEIIAQEIKSLDGLSFSINRKANEKGHLFAAIHADEVLDELRKVHKFSHITSDMLLLDKPIKETGEQTLTFASGKVQAHCKFRVDPTK